MRPQMRWILILLLLVMTGTTSSLAQQADADGDGVADGDDQCPTVAGVQSNRGCPAGVTIQPPPPSPVDTDQDGLNDPDDQCPTVAGPRENRGCPGEAPPPAPVDTDLDGLNDPDDQCPTVAGPRENRGCPDNNSGNNGNNDQGNNGNGQPNDPNGGGNSGAEPQNSGDPGQPTNPNIPVPGVTEVPDTFELPWLPDDACYVTPYTNSGVNVRGEPDLGAPILWTLNPGLRYNALGFVIKNVDELWYVLEGTGNPAPIGYASASVLAVSDACEEWTAPTTTTDAPVTPDLTTMCTLVTGYNLGAGTNNQPLGYHQWATFIYEVLPGTAIVAGAKPYAVLGELPSYADGNYDPAGWEAAAISSTDMNVETIALFGAPTGAGGMLNPGFIQQVQAYPAFMGGVNVAAGDVNGDGTSSIELPDVIISSYSVSGHGGDSSANQATDSEYSAIVFVGGWGASSYQYAFSGTYSNAAAGHGAGGGGGTGKVSVHDISVAFNTTGDINGDGIDDIILGTNQGGVNSVGGSGNDVLLGGDGDDFESASRHPGGVNVIMADGSVRFLFGDGSVRFVNDSININTAIPVLDPDSAILHRLPGAAGGTCGPIVGTAEEAATTTPTPENEPQPGGSLPTYPQTCTITTAFNLVFAFTTSPALFLPVGATPVSVINADANLADPALWTTSILQLGEDAPFAEYMQFTNADGAWIILPRIGGNCGPLGVAAAPDQNAPASDYLLQLDGVQGDTTPRAAYDAFLRLDGIKGESDDHHVVNNWNNVLDQLCGGEYVVWGETRPDGTLGNVDGECLPVGYELLYPTEYALITDFDTSEVEPNPFELVVERHTSPDRPMEYLSLNFTKVTYQTLPSGETSLDLSAVEAGEPQVLEDGTTRFEYCLAPDNADMPCVVIDIVPTCTVTAVEAKRYTIACEGEDMVEMYLVDPDAIASDGTIRAAAARLKCSNNLKQIALASHNYGDTAILIGLLLPAIQN